MPVTPKTAKDLIKGASRQRRSYRLNLAGHLVIELEQLENELAELQRVEDTKPDSAKATRRLTDKSPLVVKAQEIQTKQAEMADFWLDLVIEQKPFLEWRKFKSDNPPRQGEALDSDLECNFEVLVTTFTPTCIVEPELDAEDWKGIFDTAAAADLRDLGAAVFRVHEARLDIPLSRRASMVMAKKNGNFAPVELGE